MTRILRLVRRWQRAAVLVDQLAPAAAAAEPGEREEEQGIDYLRGRAAGERAGYQVGYREGLRDGVQTMSRLGGV